MIGELAISSSGLIQAQHRLRASAHNTANLTTDESAVVKVRGREHPPRGGVVSEISARVERAADRRTAPHVDESVEQITASHQSAALKKAVQTQDDMLGTLLDMTG